MGIIDNSTFNQRLDSLIRSLGGLRSASEIIGVKDQQIAKWRDGKARPNFLKVASLAQAAGVSLDWLATGVGDVYTGKIAEDKAGSRPATIQGFNPVPLKADTVKFIDDLAKAMIKYLNVVIEQERKTLAQSLTTDDRILQLKKTKGR